MAWPVFTQGEKVRGLRNVALNYTEFNVLNWSSRGQMCNSVLIPEQTQLVSHDTNAMKGTDVHPLM